MALRTAILSAAIKEIPKLSFTREALSAGLASIPASAVASLSAPTSPPASTSTKPLDAAAREAVIDTIFGTDSSAPRALVSAWEDYGAKQMEGVTGSPKERVFKALSKRLEWSAGAGEHLVEAYALLSTIPGPSVPISHDLLKTVNTLRSLRVPKYTPPAMLARAATNMASRHAESLLEETGDRLPLPAINPLAPLAYGWRVADEAVYAASPDKGKVGVMREPVGAGVEWYSSRVGLAAAYLSAEAHLLQPYAQSAASVAIEETAAQGAVDPADAVMESTLDGNSSAPYSPYHHSHTSMPQGNPHLPEALNALRRNLRRYEDVRGALGAVENGADGVIGFIEEASRSLAGIIRSRGF